MSGSAPPARERAHAHRSEHDGLNDFGAPPSVQPAPLPGVQVQGDRVRLRLPSKSVTVLALE